MICVFKNFKVTKVRICNSTEFLNTVFLRSEHWLNKKHGCVPADCQLYALAGGGVPMFGGYLCLQWWPPDVTSSGPVLVSPVMATRCHQQWSGACVSSDGHQMSLAGELHSQVHCIMCSGHKGTPYPLKKMWPVKTLLFRKFFGGW